MTAYIPVFFLRTVTDSIYKAKNSGFPQSIFKMKGN